MNSERLPSSLWSIQQCQEADLDELFELFQQVYKGNHRLVEKDYFDWQFKGTPFCEDSNYTFWILREGAIIKGFLGYVPIEYRFDSSIRKGACTLNWHAFDKGISGLQLLSKFLEEFDSRFLIGLSQKSINIYQSFRFPILKGMPRWIGVCDREKVASYFKITDQDHLAMLYRSAQALEESVPFEDIKSVQRFEGHQEFFWNEFPGDVGYIRRTGRYLNWRYVDIPGHDYGVITSNKNQFGVYRVEQIKDHQDCVIRILEWNFSGQFARQALAFLTNIAKERNAILIDFFSTASNVGQSLEALGFISKQMLPVDVIPYLFRPIHFADGIHMAVHVPKLGAEDTFRFEQWYITKGDSDLDRVKL